MHTTVVGIGDSVTTETVVGDGYSYISAKKKKDKVSKYTPNHKFPTLHQTQRAIMRSQIRAMQRHLEGRWTGTPKKLEGIEA